MPNPSNIHAARIFIVDDCSDTGSVLCALLTQLGFENVSCSTNGKALQNVNVANHCSLILLDMHMPSLGGLEIMRHLHGRQTDHSVPVIAISGDQRYRTVAISAGACAFLLKPFKQCELETTIYDAFSARHERLVEEN